MSYVFTYVILIIMDADMLYVASMTFSVAKLNITDTDDIL